MPASLGFYVACHFNRAEKLTDAALRENWEGTIAAVDGRWQVKLLPDFRLCATLPLPDGRTVNVGLPDPRNYTDWTGFMAAAVHALEGLTVKAESFSLPG